MARARSAARSLARSALADFIDPPWLVWVVRFELVTVCDDKAGIVATWEVLEKDHPNGSTEGLPVR
jgi:hypothetical protein